MYTAGLVERLLRNYAAIRAYLGGSPVPTQTTPLTASKPVQALRERPFGMRHGDETWPFMEVQHAKSPRDGKKRGRAIEELHVGVIDLEAGLATLNAKEYALVRAYYVEGGRTFEELAVEFGYSSAQSVGKTCQRIVWKLARTMEDHLYET